MTFWSLRYVKWGNDDLSLRRRHNIPYNTTYMEGSWCLWLDALDSGIVPSLKEDETDPALAGQHASLDSRGRWVDSCSILQTSFLQSLSSCKLYEASSYSWEHEEGEEAEVASVPWRLRPDLEVIKIEGQDNDDIVIKPVRKPPRRFQKIRSWGRLLDWSSSTVVAVFRFASPNLLLRCFPCLGPLLLARRFPLASQASLEPVFSVLRVLTPRKPFCWKERWLVFEERNQNSCKPFQLFASQDPV